MDRTQQEIRKIMIKSCYEEAGENVVLSDACDTFEKDIIKLLWGELNFLELVIIHKDKYIFVFEKMKELTFHTLIEELRPVYTELSDLIDEIVAHLDVIVVRIKRHHNDLSEHYLSEARRFAKNPEPIIQKTDITVIQSINNPNVKFENIRPPPPIRHDSGTSRIFQHKNPYNAVVDTIRHKGVSRLKHMYGGINKMEMNYDPDHMYNAKSSHRDHQHLAVNNAFIGGTESRIDGDKLGNKDPMAILGGKENEFEEEYNDDDEIRTRMKRRKRKLKKSVYGRFSREGRQNKFRRRGRRDTHRTRMGKQQYFI